MHVYVYAYVHINVRVYVYIHTSQLGYGYTYTRKVGFDVPSDQRRRMDKEQDDKNLRIEHENGTVVTDHQLNVWEKRNTLQEEIVGKR